MDWSIGQVVPSHFDPGIIAASYLASLCGTLLTVELLHRRGTGVNTVRSWLETLSCATALGVMGIWCMHFIGNRAIIMGDGAAKIQLVYSPGYSTLSVFLPIIGLTIAFGAAEYPSTSPILHWAALTCTGVFAGLSIVGMHYIGNFGVSNYKLTYIPQFLAASVIIAIGDCLGVLMLFYTWREKWISLWWKRAGCAVGLAGGVSAMHFTASTHCIYQLKHYNKHSAVRSRDFQVIVAGILCGTAAIIVLCVLFFTRHRTRVLKRSAKKVMLACAMFDPDGRILVTTEGVLPAKEITDKYNHRTFEEDFDTAHPVFQWIFRITHNWAGVSDLIPRMKNHLGARREDSDDMSRPSSSGSSAHYDPETCHDYSIIFRERFCTAAASLAASLHIPVEKIGVLYDRIIDTGTLKTDDRLGRRSTMYKSRGDVESALRHSVFGRGQVLFLARQLEPDQTDKLLNAGLRFAGIQQVARNIAETMQIPLSEVEGHLHDLRKYVDNLSTVEKPGTWLSFFAVMPKANSKGFDVVVKGAQQDQLPDTQILSYEPVPWQLSFLQRIDGCQPAVCLGFFENYQQRNHPGRTLEEQAFATTMTRAFRILEKQVPRAWFENARFVGVPVYAHYTEPLRSRSPVTTMCSLVVTCDPHTSLDGCSGLTRVPLSFFTIRQQCYAGSPNHVTMVQDIHQEFGPLLTRRGAKSSNSREKIFSRHSRKSTAPQTRRPSVAPSISEQSDTYSSSDTHELVDKPRHVSRYNSETTPGAERDASWGGILVNSETVIQSDTKSEVSANLRTHDMGFRAAATISRPEATFVDELFEKARKYMTASSS